jgi:hypothetical protein
MEIALTEFEVRYFGEDHWQKVSEINVLKQLADKFGKVSPIVTEMLKGKEIVTSNAIYRIKNWEDKEKEHEYSAE